MSRRIHVISTGGTIASRSDGEALRASDSGERLLASVTGLPCDVDVEVEELFVRGSFQMTTAEMAQIADACSTAASRPGVTGVVVTHGTDTMEESAYLTDLFVGSEAPVVFTGAQHPADDPDRDGPRNLRDAILLAADPRAARIGVVVAMAGRAYPARAVRKLRTLAVDAFGALGCGPCAQVFGEQVVVSALPDRPARFAGPAARVAGTRVDIVAVHAGGDPTLLRAAVGAGARGVVLEALGAGNAPPSYLDAVADATAAGVLILVTSRCLEGPVAPLYAAGGGYDLAKAGAVFAGTLSHAHARILLLAALATGRTPDDVRRLVEPHLLL